MGVGKCEKSENGKAKKREPDTAVPQGGRKVALGSG